MVASFSSRGPTLDGRLKPDIVAPVLNLKKRRDWLWIIFFLFSNRVNLWWLQRLARATNVPHQARLSLLLLWLVPLPSFISNRLKFVKTACFQRFSAYRYLGATRAGQPIRSATVKALLLHSGRRVASAGSSASASDVDRAQVRRDNAFAASFDVFLRCRTPAHGHRMCTATVVWHWMMWSLDLVQPSKLRLSLSKNNWLLVQGTQHIYDHQFQVFLFEIM